MDAFAVSIGLGARRNAGAASANLPTSDMPSAGSDHCAVSEPHPLSFSAHKTTALLAAVYFGVFQGLMPLVGYLLGHTVLGWASEYTHWLAGLLLVGIGLKMLYEAFSSLDDDKEGANDDAKKQLTHGVFLGLAIATSIDAMAAGFSLHLFDFNALSACVVIGLITAAMSYLGVWLGSKSVSWIGNKSEVLGGIILLLIAAKVVLVS